MKKVFIALVLMFSLISAAVAEVQVYSEKNKFGLISSEGAKITKPIYTKLIRLSDSSFIFCRHLKYGIISNTGEILVKPKYTKAQRFIGRYAKLGAGNKYYLYDENGDEIIDGYSSIELMFGRMFLVGKNFKYGLISFDGDIILAPVADDIYMPKPNLLKIKYDNVWYAIEQKNKGTIELPDDILMLNDNNNFNVMTFVENPVISTGYGIVSAGDYFIKLFSSISPAYESAIDELIFDQGADSVSVLAKSSWLVKFPFVYIRNYVNNFKAPNTGPLSDVKDNLRHKINESAKEETKE